MGGTDVWWRSGEDVLHFCFAFLFLLSLAFKPRQGRGRHGIGPLFPSLYSKLPSLAISSYSLPAIIPVIVCGGRGPDYAILLMPNQASPAYRQ